MSLKVLFVDDEDNILKSLKRDMVLVDIDALYLNNAVEALELLKTEHVDIIVSDVRMPKMDGISFLKKVQKNYPHINRIILSGYVKESEVKRALIQCAATMYFTKPWSVDDLLSYFDYIEQSNEMIEDKNLREFINSIDSIPSSPEIYSKINVAISEDKDIDDILIIIEESPSLIAKLMHIANSVIFGGLKCDSIGKAIKYIGLETIKELSFLDSLGEKWDLNPVLNDERQKIIEHSLLTSAIFSKIYCQNDEARQEILTPTCLLQNIGMIILLHLFPDQYLQTRECMTTNPSLSFHEAEIQRGNSGRTHVEIGSYFLRLWNLPESCIQAALYHHDPMSAPVLIRPFCVNLSDCNKFAHLLINQKSAEEIHSTLGDSMISKDDMNAVISAFSTERSRKPESLLNSNRRN